MHAVKDQMGHLSIDEQNTPTDCPEKLNIARYDRQIRLWGDRGQHDISQTEVLVLGATALSTEILKCLVLAGIRGFKVVDNSFVTERDFGHNFFIRKGDLGKPKAKVVTEALKELNSAVRGDFDVCDLEEVADFSSFDSFSIVIGANIKSALARRVFNHLQPLNVPFIWTLSLGLLGYARICVGDHEVHNDHAENSPLWKPFPRLQEYVNSIDLDALDHEQHSHVPFLVLYLKALPIWQNDHPDELPIGGAKKKSFAHLLNDMRMGNENGILDEANFQEAVDNLFRSFAGFHIPSNVKKVFADPRADAANLTEQNATAFWVYVAALKRFYQNHGCLPLSGSLPDMTSDTMSYTTLVRLYSEQAELETNQVLETSVTILKECGLDGKLSQLNYKDCREMCKNASRIDVLTGTCLIAELDNSPAILAKRIWAEVQFEEPDARSVHPLAWLLVLRARDCFALSKNRPPGTNGVPLQLDAVDLDQRLKNMLEETGVSRALRPSHIAGRRRPQEQGPDRVAGRGPRGLSIWDQRTERGQLNSRWNRGPRGHQDLHSAICSHT